MIKYETMKRLHYLIYVVVITLVIGSCTNYDINPEPMAKMSLEKTTFNVLEQVKVTNEGAGEYYSFWPGDQSHNYALREEGKDFGLIPNQGKDFNYSYLYTGTYTLVMVASSYDEESGALTEKVDSVQITVVEGNSGNIIENIEIYNCLRNYNAIGRMVGTDSILFPIDFYNRAMGVPDSDYLAIINRRSFVFSVSLFAKVYGNNDVLLTGLPDDTYQCDLIEPVSYRPFYCNPKISTLKVVGQGNSTRVYTLAAMFYPEMFSFSAEGKNAVKFSSNGLTADADSLSFMSCYSDSMYFAIKIKTLKTEWDAVPTFSVTPGCTVRLAGMEGEQVSGVTTVKFRKSAPLLYYITRTVNGFTLTSKVAVYIK